MPIQPTLRNAFFARRAAAPFLGLLLLASAAARPAASAQEQTPTDPAAEDTRLAATTTTIVRGAADLRYRNGNRATRGSYIAALRLTADWTKRKPGTNITQGGARVQVYLEPDTPRTATDRLRASEVYGYYNFALPGVSAQVRAGQFALPFGLTAAYDPLQPIQPLYDKALGTRVDTGIMLSGEYAPFHYAAAITTGTGPNRTDFDANKQIMFRLSRALDTRLGRVEVGGSLLTGRGPVTAFDTELPPSGTSGARQFVDKTRFAGDGQYFYGPLTARGEFVFGGDGEEPVWGYFAEGNYQTAPRLSLVAFRKRWTFPIKPQTATTSGLGFDYDMGRGFLLRTLFEYERQVPLPAGTDPIIIKRITIQTRLSF